MNFIEPVAEAVLVEQVVAIRDAHCLRSLDWAEADHTVLGGIQIERTLVALFYAHNELTDYWWEVTLNLLLS